MIEIILHDICDTFPYLKYGLAAAVCTALALTVLNHSRIMDKEKRSNYVSLLGKSMFLAFYGATNTTGNSSPLLLWIVMISTAVLPAPVRLTSP